ncbi:Alpha/Beta hydrolase protein [Chytriomyces sp. MP71]|nr:Alpha/Beta hydrolase protein [Chytriomyces sp. MP71]
MLSDLPLLARRAAQAGALYLLWRQRRGALGTLLYLLLVALPTSAAQKLVGSKAVPTQLDVWTAAVIRVIRWSSQGSVQQVASGLTKVSLAEAVVARRMGAIIKRVKTPDGNVEGCWIAGRLDHIPTFDPPKECVVLLYIHGGGYCANNCESLAPHHFELIRTFNALVEGTKHLVIFSLEYPLAPKHKFPAAVDAAQDAYLWLVQSVGVKTLLVGGDSAGGHCAIHLMNRIGGRLALPQLAVLPVKPLASLLFSPYVDADAVNIAKDRLHFDSIHLDVTHTFSRHAFGGVPENIHNLMVLPAKDFHFAPKGTLVIYGNAEYLSGPIEVFLGRLSKGRGVPGLEVHKYEGMPHDFNVMFILPAYPATRPHALNAVQKTAVFIQKAVDS